MKRPAIVLSLVYSQEIKTSGVTIGRHIVHTIWEIIKKTLHYGDHAIQALAQQDNVSDDVIAEIYEHMGIAFLDLKRYDESIECLKKSIRYNNLPTTIENLKIAEANKNSSGGFLSNYSASKIVLSKP